MAKVTASTILHEAAKLKERKQSDYQGEMFKEEDYFPFGNKSYIHTPFPFTRNEKLFWESSFHLKSLYPFNDIWICTLNSELSLSSQPNKVSQLDISSPNFSESFLINEAKKICKNFLEGRANKRSFSVSDERFIPPHQYFAAKYYLEKIEK